MQSRELRICLWVGLLRFLKDVKLPARREQRFDLPQQYRQGFSFYKVVISTRLDCVFPGFLFCPDSADYYLNIRMAFLQFSCGLRTVHPRHTDVHDYQIQAVLIDEFKALLAAIYKSNQINIFLGFKIRSNSCAKQITIVNNECFYSVLWHFDSVLMGKHL